MIKNILFIGFGSFLGGISRYGISLFFKNSSNTNFPISTFLVNLIGCLILGIILGFFEKTSHTTNSLFLFLTIGFCGGFTTFSTLAIENYHLIKNGQLIAFATYTSLSIFLGILLIYFGFQLSKISV